MADDDLSINFSINPELSLQQLLAQGEIIQEVLRSAANRAATAVDREFVGLGQRQLDLLARNARAAFETVRDQSGKTKTQIREDLRNFNALFGQLTQAIANVGNLGFEVLESASKKATKELNADSKARIAQFAQEGADARRERLKSADELRAITRATAIEETKTREQGKRNEGAVLLAADKAIAQASGRIAVEQFKEDAREKARATAAADAKRIQDAREEAKTEAKITRDGLNEIARLRQQADQDERNDKRQKLSEDKRLTDQATQVARDAIRDRQSAERRSHLDGLEATRSANRLELAEEKGHQFRKSEVLKTGLDLFRTQVRNFVIRRREDQRTANRLEVIEDERKAAESVAVKQSELRQIEQLSRASIARQQVAARAQTISSQGVTGAALGRSSIGIGVRNLALAGGGILSARNTFTIGADFVGALRVAQAQLNLTDTELKRVRDTSIELGKAMDLPGVSAKDAAEAMLQLAKAGLTVDQTLASAKGTLQLGRAVNADFAESAYQVGVALNVFDIKASDATKVADILAKTVAISGGTSFQDLALAVKGASAVFAANQVDTLGANNAYALLNATLAVLAKNGLGGQVGGDALKRTIQQLHSASGPVAESLGEIAKRAGVLSIGYDDLTKKARPFNESVRLLAKGLEGLSQEERDTKLTQIFGSDAERAAQILVASADDLDAAYKSILASQRTASTKGFAEQLAAAQNKGLRGALDILKSQIETFQILLFEKVERPIQVAVLAIAKGLDALANSKSFEAIRAGLKIVAIAAAGLLIAKVAAESLQFLTLAVKALAFSPFGLITVGVLGAAFAIGYFASKNKEFGEQLAILTGKLALLGPLLLKDLVQGDIKAAAGHLIEILKLIGNFPLIQLVKETIVNAGKLVVNTAINLGRTVAAGVVAGFELAKDLGPKILDAVENAVRSAATSAVAIGKTILEKLGDGIEFAQDNKLAQKVGAAILGGIQEAGRILAQVLTDDLTIKIVTGIAAGLAAGAILIVGAFVKGFITGLIQNRGEIAGALLDILEFAVKAALKGLVSIITGSPIWGTLTVFLGSVFAGVKLFSFASNSFKGFQTNVRSGLAAMNGDFEKSRLIVAEHQKTLRVTRVGELDALGSSLPRIGRAIDQGLVQPWIKASNAVRGFLNLAPRATGVAAPTVGAVQGPRLQAPLLPPLNTQVPVVGPNQVIPRALSFDPNESARLAKLTDEINKPTGFTRAVQAAGAAAAVAAVGLASYFAFSSDDTTTKVLSLTTAVTGIVTAFATGGPIVGGFAIAAAGIGAVMGSNAKATKEAGERTKDWIAILKESDATLRRQKAVDEFTAKIDEGSKTAKAFAQDLGGNFSDLADAIFSGAGAVKQYKDALLEIAVQEALIGEGPFGDETARRLGDLTRSGMNYADAVGVIRKEIERKGGFDFIDEQAEAYGRAVKNQELLKLAVGNSKDQQERLTRLSELDAQSRKDALDAQKEFLALVASNKSGVNALALGLEGSLKQFADIGKAPAEDQARLRVELEQTRLALTGDYVRGVQSAIAEADKLGISPVAAVEAYKNALRDKLTNPDTGLGLAKGKADELIAKLDELGGKQVQAEIDLKLVIDDEEAKRRIREVFGVIGVGGKLDTTGAIIDLGGAEQGAIIRKEQIIRVGEKNKPEVIIPLTDPVRAAQLASASGLLDVLASNGDALNGALFAAAAQQTIKAEVKVTADSATFPDIRTPSLTPTTPPFNPGTDGSFFGEKDKADLDQVEDRRGDVSLQRLRALADFTGNLRRRIDEIIAQARTNIDGIDGPALSAEIVIHDADWEKVTGEAQDLAAQIASIGDRSGPAVDELKTKIGTDLLNAINDARDHAAQFDESPSEAVEVLAGQIQRDLVVKFGLAEGAAADLINEMGKIAKDIAVNVHFNSTINPTLQAVFDSLPAGDLGIDIGPTVIGLQLQGTVVPNEVPPVEVPARLGDFSTDAFEAARAGLQQPIEIPAPDFTLPDFAGAGTSIAEVTDLIARAQAGGEDFLAGLEELAAQSVVIPVDMDTTAAQAKIDALLAQTDAAELDRAFARSVAGGLDAVIAGGATETVAPAAAGPVGPQAPLIGELNINEVAGDPVATVMVAGAIIAAKVQGALH